MTEIKTESVALPINIVMSDEELFRGFRERWPHPSPMWNMLWSPDGFFSDSTFEENIDRLLPSGEIRDRVKEFFDGKRWHISELSEECREKFEFFMLDYRSGACFVHSRQVDDYALRVLNINLGEIIYEWDNSVLTNDTLFDWSDTIEKAREFVKEEIPTGADTVMYLLLKCFDGNDMLPAYEPDPINVYFHGEHVDHYMYKPYDYKLQEYEYPWFVSDDGIPLLVALSLGGYKNFLGYKWTTESIDFAIECVESELSFIRDRETIESDCCIFLRGKISDLEESLNDLKSLDYSWSVPERIGMPNNTIFYGQDDALITEIEYMEKSLKCECGQSSAKDCEWKKRGNCCQGCPRDKKRKRS